MCFCAVFWHNMLLSKNLIKIPFAFPCKCFGFLRRCSNSFIPFVLLLQISNGFPKMGPDAFCSESFVHVDDVPYNNDMYFQAIFLSRKVTLIVFILFVLCPNLNFHMLDLVYLPVLFTIILKLSFVTFLIFIFKY